MKTPTLLALTLALVVTLSGCSKLTAENYGKLTAGMSYDEVVLLIGKPNSCDDVMGFRSCTWGDESHSVHVQFAGDKVLLFSSSNLR